MTNDEFCNLTLKTRLAPVSSLVFSFSPAFIYGRGQWRRWGASQQTVGGRQEDSLDRSPVHTHTHTLAVSHTHTRGNVSGVLEETRMEAPHSKARELESNLQHCYFGSTNCSPSLQTQERTSQYFANTQLQLCPTPGAAGHVAVKRCQRTTVEWKGQRSLPTCALTNTQTLQPAFPAGLQPAATLWTPQWATNELGRWSAQQWPHTLS